MYGRRVGLSADWSKVFEEAARTGTALELDATPSRQDLDVELARLAMRSGVEWFSIGSDAHSIKELEFVPFGLATAIPRGDPTRSCLELSLRGVRQGVGEAIAGRRRQSSSSIDLNRGNTPPTAFWTRGLGSRGGMRTPEDELIIALSHGLDGWMLGSRTDAVEIATFLDTTDNRVIPRTAEAMEELLGDLLDAGLVERRWPSASEKLAHERFHAYGLTEAGWTRAREMEPPVQEDP